MFFGKCYNVFETCTKEILKNWELVKSFKKIQLVKGLMILQKGPNEEGGWGVG